MATKHYKKKKQTKKNKGKVGKRTQKGGEPHKIGMPPPPKIKKKSIFSTIFGSSKKPIPQNPFAGLNYNNINAKDKARIAILQHQSTTSLLKNPPQHLTKYNQIRPYYNLVREKGVQLSVPELGAIALRLGLTNVHNTLVQSRKGQLNVQRKQAEFKEVAKRLKLALARREANAERSAITNSIV